MFNTHSRLQFVLKKLLKQPEQTNGQALIEFVFVLPILLGFMLAVWAIGSWMYSGTNASSSLRAIMDNQFRYADSADALPLIQGDAAGISTGPIADLGSGVDNVNVFGNGTLYPVIQGQKNINIAGVAGVLNIPPVSVFGTFMLNGGLFLANGGGIGTAPGIVPYNSAAPASAVNIAPSNYNFSNQNQLPNSVPIDDSCHASVLAFDDQNIDMSDPQYTCYDPELDTDGDGILDWDLDDPADGVAEINDPCKIEQATIYVSQHLAQIQALDGCDAANGTPHRLADSSDVTFRDSGNYAY